MKRRNWMKWRNSCLSLQKRILNILNKMTEVNERRNSCLFLQKGILNIQDEMTLNEIYGLLHLQCHLVSCSHLNLIDPHAHTHTHAHTQRDHGECHSVVCSHLNLIGLFSTERGKRDHGECHSVGKRDHGECHSVVFLHLNLIGLFSTERGKRDHGECHSVVFSHLNLIGLTFRWKETTESVIQSYAHISMSLVSFQRNVAKET